MRFGLTMHCRPALTYTIATFSEVFKATQLATGKQVALKRILMHNESQGVPITAIREIKLLKRLQHRNVVELVDIVVELGKTVFTHLMFPMLNRSIATEKDKGSIHMVFPYMDHDLAGLLENTHVSLQPSQIKLYMKQLLEGTAYLHRVSVYRQSHYLTITDVKRTTSRRTISFIVISKLQTCLYRMTVHCK